VLFWLNIVAERGQTVDAIVREHWARFGRNYYARHDYEAIESGRANALIEELTRALPALPGQNFGLLTVAAADSFCYTDPVDASVSANQGLRVLFKDGSRIVFRLSGTGTEGATLRVYLEAYEPADGAIDRETPDMLADLIAAAEAIAGIARHTGRTHPDVVT
jgi:phosphoglucomutase